jgi:hypothetical protein
MRFLLLKNLMTSWTMSRFENPPHHDAWVGSAYPLQMGKCRWVPRGNPDPKTKVVSDAEGPHLNRPFLSGSPFPSPTFRPVKLGTGNQRSRTGFKPLHCPGQTANPQWCVLKQPLGTQIGLGWVRQNERDKAMVKDPPTDLEEVVGGIRSPGSITNPADLCSTL